MLIEKYKEAQNWVKTVALPAIRNLLFKHSKAEKPISKILCIDDDRSFCLFIQRMAHSLGIQVDVAYSAQEGRKAIEKTPYQAFIIDGHLPDGSGFELVAWIREKKGLPLPIGFISRIYQDAASFRILKDSLKVDYVLEKPIRPSEVQQFLIQLCQLQSRVDTNQPLSDHLFADLQVAYQKTIPDKIERLEKIILAIQKDPTIENLQSLKFEVHKIAGSAGSYGYTIAGEICKNLELDLMKQIDLMKKGLLNPEWLLSLDDFFTQIKLHFQIGTVETDLHPTQRSRYLSSVYIVSENTAYLESFISANKEKDFNILVESRPDRAIQTLSSSDFYPRIFLLDAQYQNSQLTGYDLVKAFYQKIDDLTAMIAMCIEKDNSNQKIEALEHGMTFIAEKPFSPALMLSFLDYIPFRPFPLQYKILVVDDDLDSCEYIVKNLKYKGLEVKALQDIQDLQAVLSNEDPDLILLDIHLRHESGMGMLEFLRQKLKYKKLLVGMFTVTPQETYLIQQCYDFNADEILFKPLEVGILQNKITYLLRKQFIKQISDAKDVLSELESRETFERYLNFLQDEKNLSFPTVVALFEVKDKDNDKKLIPLIPKFLGDLLKKFEMAAYIGEGQFALIFRYYDVNFIQLFFRFFLARLSSNLQKTLHQTHPVEIAAAIITVSKEERGEKIIKRAQDQLALAKQSEKESLSLICEERHDLLKKVMIWSDQPEISHQIHLLFDEQEFQIQSFSQWDEEAFDRTLESGLLYILAGNYVKLHGSSAIKKLYGSHSIRLPFLYLSNASRVDDLHHLFTKINYFQSPFRFILFME